MNLYATDFFIDESIVSRYNDAAFADIRFIRAVGVRGCVRAGPRKREEEASEVVISRGRVFERFSESAKMSLLSEQFGERALPGVGKVSAIFLLTVLVGRLLGHVVARVALSICCLMRAFWTRTIRAGLCGARRYLSAPRTAGPACEQVVEVLVYLPNA